MLPTISVGVRPRFVGPSVFPLPPATGTTSVDEPPMLLSVNLATSDPAVGFGTDPTTCEIMIIPRVFLIVAHLLNVVS